MMKISRFTTSQRCAFGPDDCLGYLSIVFVIVVFKKRIRDDVSSIGFSTYGEPM